MDTTLNKNNAGWSSAVIFFSIFLIILLYFNRSFIIYLLDANNFLPKKEKYTELYFNDHLALPKVIEVGKHVEFSFTIHNLEGKNMDYFYRIYFRPVQGQEVEIDSNILNIDDGASRTITEAVVRQQISGKGTIIVDIPSLSQEIHFSLSNNL